MFVVRVSHNDSTIYALSYKTKKAATNRYNKAAEVFNKNGFKAELIQEDDNTDIIQKYYFD